MDSTTSSAVAATRARAGDWRGVALALLVLALWALGLAVLLPLRWAALGAWVWAVVPLGVVAMTHLYTGLFITAHDAMHGTLAPGRPLLNDALGRLCTLLFAFNSWARLRPKHHRHHRHVATADDPDFHHLDDHSTGQWGFWRWYVKFGAEYITWPQLLAMAATFNVLYRVFFPIENVILFWMLPSVLSTFQLFYFGTYLPHRDEPEAPQNAHHSRSQRRHHLWAFVSCYFFGYHYEHHDSPATPWWQLWRVKDLTGR